MSGDRGRYSRVSRRIWNDGGFRALSQPKPCGGWLFFRLLTGPELTSIPGLFQAWEAGLAQALGWSIKDFRRCFAEVEREGLAKADWSTGLIWLPKAVHHNEPESINVVVGWRTFWHELPDCDLKDEADGALLAWARSKGKPWAEAYGKATGKAWAIQEQEQDQEQEQEQEQEEAQASLPLGAPNGKPSKSKPKPASPQPMAGDYAPDPRLVAALAEKHGISKRQILKLVPEFIWYWTAGDGSGTRRAGWDPTFRSHVDRLAHAGRIPADSNGAEELPFEVQ